MKETWDFCIKYCNRKHELLAGEMNDETKKWTSLYQIKDPVSDSSVTAGGQSSDINF